MAINPFDRPNATSLGNTREHAEAKVRQFNTLPWVIESGSQFYVKQKEDGSWQNQNNRWWEKDSALVTAYSVMTLRLIEARL